MQNPPARHEIPLVGVVLNIRYRAGRRVPSARFRRDARVVEVDLVADSHVGGAVVEGALDEAFDDVEEDARGAVVGAADGALEGEGEAVDVGLHPVPADGDAINKNPFFVSVGAELVQDRGVGFKGSLGAVEEVAEEVVEGHEGEDVEGDEPDGEEEPERGGEDEDALGDKEDGWRENGGEEVEEGDEVGAEELPGRGSVGQWRTSGALGLEKGMRGVEFSSVAVEAILEWWTLE
ncbi:hypothetical protein V498_05463 [Pseudogymnoascus sp. VKM F-4517 (FW-2822)]|nr:hypothetical protein V498_05463 [Pseudogymnoascus sp. VKM F-4517 (FW-2822)]